MSQRKTNRGQVIDFDSLLAQQGSTTALGNMGTDGKGNVLGPGGQVLETNEQRVRKYLKDNPVTADDQVSLKVTEKEAASVNDGASIVETKTAKTQQENVRTAKLTPDPVVEPDEFDAPEGMEPLGYREVELPNGDIQMVPYYTEDDA